MSHRGRAVRLVLTATFLYASVPPILHVAASDTNPFYFNFMITIMQVSIPGLFLLYSKDSYVNRHLSTTQRRDLKRPRVHFTYFRRTSGHTGNRKSVVLKESGRKDVLGWARMPIVWALISSLHYGFLAWSANILETAVATTIFELWPVFLVYALARHEDSDRLFRRAPVSVGHSRRAISKEVMVLTALAGSGLALMLGSQAAGQIRSATDLVSYKVAAGMVIAVVASLLAALSVLSNLAYGKVLYYALVPAGGTQPPRGDRSLETRPIEQRGDPDRRLLIWLTLLGYVLSRVVALPVNVLIGLLTPQVQGSLTWGAVLGAMVIGAAVSVAGMLLRVGNIRSEDTAVNSLLCLGPAVSLLALMALGITLPRFDLFVVGAVLILAVNVRIQLRRDASHGTR
ncbi:MAG: hypothetical protein F4118_05335 [Acidimicrobiaceae bacterium]|nr:hypothetical protein [Acidimicrobiaceae bacterium]